MYICLSKNQTVFVRAAGLRNPIVLGASMSGEICLELAYRHPEAFAAIIACEASERIEGRTKQRVELVKPTLVVRRTTAEPPP